MAEPGAACKLIRAARRAAPVMGVMPPALFLTDPARTPDPLQTAARLPPGWGVVYRHFGAADRAETVTRLAALCRIRHLAFLIAADPHLAADLCADGVHWPERRAHEARRWRSRFAVQTASAHSPAAIRRLSSLPLDALLVSAVFPSGSASAGPAMGAVRFRALARQSALPLYALGGVNAHTAPQLGGVAGLAAVGGIAGVFGPAAS